MSKKPFFSVIIPSYNRKKLLAKAVDSVLNQSFEDWELIIVDDGSTDGTDKLLQKYTDARIRSVRQQNFGVSHARNRGISMAHADWICFLDSDDTWMPEKLKRTRAAIRKNPKTYFFHTEETWMKDGKEVYQPERYCRPSGKAYTDVVMVSAIDTSTVAVHTKVFSEVGMFDEDLPACEDYDLWLRVTSRFEIALIPEPLTVKQKGYDDELSASPGIEQYRIEALVKMLNQQALNVEDYEVTVDELAFQSEQFLEEAIQNNRLTRIWQYQDALNSLI